MFNRLIKLTEDVVIDYSDCYAISPSLSHSPIFFKDVNHWLVAISLWPSYITELPITDNNHSVFNEETYDNFLIDFIRKDIDYIILEHKFNRLLVNNLDEILLPILNDNLSVVTQYKNGNIKIINSLIGKVLKQANGLDPNEIKAGLIKLIEAGINE